MVKKLITVVYFQIGVNVIGLPEIVAHNIAKALAPKVTLFQTSVNRKWQQF